VHTARRRSMVVIPCNVGGLELESWKDKRQGSVRFWSRTAPGVFAETQSLIDALTYAIQGLPSCIANKRSITVVYINIKDKETSESFYFYMK
jgi:hypothetical protein